MHLYCGVMVSRIWLEKFKKPCGRWRGRERSKTRASSRGGMQTNYPGVVLEVPRSRTNAFVPPCELRSSRMEPPYPEHSSVRHKKEATTNTKCWRQYSVSTWQMYQQVSQTDIYHFLLYLM